MVLARDRRGTGGRYEQWETYEILAKLEQQETTPGLGCAGGSLTENVKPPEGSGRE
jgi:hypothetical protein